MVILVISAKHLFFVFRRIFMCYGVIQLFSDYLDRIINNLLKAPSQNWRKVSKMPSNHIRSEVWRRRGHGKWRVCFGRSRGAEIEEPARPSSNRAPRPGTSLSFHLDPETSQGVFSPAEPLDGKRMRTSRALEKTFPKYEHDWTRRNVRTISSACCGPEPTSHTLCSSSSLRRIEQMLSENVDWNRIQKTRSEKLGISDSS